MTAPLARSPGSEKESGLALTIPMTSGLDHTNVRPLIHSSVMCPRSLLDQPPGQS